MKMTIITPSYNQGEFLEETIRSVLNQNLDGLEYWVLDGGSTDESVEILRKYEDRLAWVSEKDGGQTDAVNKGLQRAQGEIIGWLNSDDIYYPDACRKVLAYFERHPEAMVVYGQADHIDREGNWLEAYPTEKWDYARLHEVCFLCQPAVFFRKEVVRELGYLNDALNYCMDYEYWLRLGQVHPFHFLPEKLAGSRLYAENKTLGAKSAVHREILEMLYEKTNQLSSYWLFHYGHAVAADAGLQRNTPAEEWQFVKTVCRACLQESWRLTKQVSWSDVKVLTGWLWNAGKKVYGR